MLEVGPQRHVVAGQDDTTVQIEGEGGKHDADVVWFDVDRWAWTGAAQPTR